MAAGNTLFVRRSRNFNPGKQGVETIQAAGSNLAA
jgi:hypothetical protein